MIIFYFPIYIGLKNIFIYKSEIASNKFSTFNLRIEFLRLNV